MKCHRHQEFIRFLTREYHVRRARPCRCSPQDHNQVQQAARGDVACPLTWNYSNPMLQPFDRS
jgi:hypothetical protein